MNENKFLNSNGDNIGIDPSSIPVIESLDVMPSEPGSNNLKNKNSNEKQKPSLIKKILFTIVVLLLMGGVSFGVYYYLSLGTKNASKINFSISDRVVFVNETLSNSIMDYGEFNSVNITQCSLDTSKVDTSKTGVYSYYVTCGTMKKEAKITVQEKITFDVAAKAIYKIVDNEVKASEFIDTDRDEYELTFVDETTVNSYLENEGGPYLVGIKVKNEKGQETVVNSLLYVLPEKAKLYLTCSKDNDEYTITDKFAVNYDSKNMNYSLRFYKYTYDIESDYETSKNLIEDGKLTIGDHTGYALIDNVNKTIRIVDKLTGDKLDSEYGATFPLTYSEIKGYYKDIKNYSCSI